MECGDGKRYIGSSEDVHVRFRSHELGEVTATKTRLPVKLVYYEVCLSKEQILKRERYFKTGFGRAFLKSRLGEGL